MLSAKEVIVTLKNGDQLSGAIIDEDKQQQNILLNSPLLGLITIKQGDIRNIDVQTPSQGEGDQAQTISKENSLPAIVQSSQSSTTENASSNKTVANASNSTAPAGNISLSTGAPKNANVPSDKSNSAQPQAIPSTQVAANTAATPAAPQKVAAVQIPPKKPADAASSPPGKEDKSAQAVVTPPKVPWKGKFEVGLNHYTGRRDLSSIYLMVDAKKTYHQSSHALYARYLYSEQTGTRNSDRLDTHYRYRHEIGKSAQFLQAQTTFFYDGVANIDQNWEQNISIGRNFIEKSLHNLNSSIGVTGQRRTYSGNDTFNTLLLELNQDYTYKISKILRFEQRFSIQYAPTGSKQRVYSDSEGTREAANYKYTFKLALLGDITKLLTLILRFEYEYDNVIYLKNARKDQRIIATLGYKF